jgi:peptide/nickel transport system permease protein
MRPDASRTVRIPGGDSSAIRPPRIVESEDVDSLGPTRPRPNRLIGYLPLARLLLVAAAPLLAPADPLRVDLTAVGLPPSPAHPFGTDRVGRDLFSRWLVGGQTSIVVAALAAAFAVLIGVLLGAHAGYRGGRLGALIDRFVDVALALPIFFVAIALQATLPPGALGVVLVIGATGWMSPARVIRARVLQTRTQPFVEAARALGGSDGWILRRHVLPQCVGTIAATLTTSFGEAILLQSTLSFLGLGLPPPSPSWGGMLLDALPEVLHGAWLPVLLPGFSIMAATAAVGAAARRLR